MEIEIFESYREFYKKYPSHLYHCCWCNKLSANPDICTQCNQQANTLFKDTYKYKINNQVKQIFKPIELIKGENNEQARTEN